MRMLFASLPLLISLLMATHEPGPMVEIGEVVLPKTSLTCYSPLETGEHIDKSYSPDSVNRCERPIVADCRKTDSPFPEEDF